MSEKRIGIDIRMPETITKDRSVSKRTRYFSKNTCYFRLIRKELSKDKRAWMRLLIFSITVLTVTSD